MVDYKAPFYFYLIVGLICSLVVFLALFGRWWYRRRRNDQEGRKELVVDPQQASYVPAGPLAALGQGVRDALAFGGITSRSIGD